jgi:hypothetical protein
METLFTADLSSPTEVQAHVGTCERCTRAVEIFRTAERSLAESLALVEAGAVPPEHVAAMAWNRVRRQRFVRRIVIPVAMVLAVLATALFVTKLGPEIKRMTGAPPPVVTQTFTLRCLSPDQAESLLRPYLPVPQNPRWQAEMFDVRPAADGLRAVTVRAPAATLALVPKLLERFENDPGAACRR